MLTLGCRVNQYETEFIRSQWEKAGGVECGDMDNAQYICINSCAVTSNAERESRNAIYRAKKKQSRGIYNHDRLRRKDCNHFRPRKTLFWAEPDAIICNKNDPLAGPKGLAEKFARFFPARHPLKQAAIPGLWSRRRMAATAIAHIALRRKPGQAESRHPQAILAEISSFLARGWGEVVLSGIQFAFMCGKGITRAYGDFCGSSEFSGNGACPLLALAMPVSA